MADRGAAEIFSLIFRRLAEDPTDQHRNWAREFWKKSQNFDFSNYQLECDEALEKLGLARKGPDPEYPDEIVTLYGPTALDGPAKGT